MSGLEEGLPEHRPPPSADFQVRFLKNLQRILEEGRFTATYKFALVHRVFWFRRDPRLFLRQGVLDEVCRLEPEKHPRDGSGTH